MGTFDGLSAALSGLNAQRRGLDIVGQNVANVNTDGYSRQPVVHTAVGVPATFAGWKGTAAGGVTVAQLDRFRDGFLEVRAHLEHGQQERLAQEQVVLARVAQAFAEPGDQGVQALLDDFWAGWHQVANHPGDLSARSQLLQQADTLTDAVSSAHSALDARWQSGRDQLTITVQDANAVAATVAQLNQVVQQAQAAGQQASQAADQRDLLVVRLAETLGTTARPGENGAVDVFIGGTALVRGSHSEQLTVTGAVDLADAGSDPVSVRWAKDGYPARVDQGRAAALVSAVQTVVPGYASRLDTVATTLVATVNAAHQAGFDLAGAQGGDFFAGTSAADLRVAITDPAAVAASSVAGGNLDGGNADVLAALAGRPNGGDETYRQLVVDLGIAGQSANRRLSVQKAVSAQVDAAREEYSGVNVDEEMVSMLNDHRAYESAARMLSAVDATLDRLINRTGLVGR
jgi:flagellar hook-associated protein 1 FlgK